MKAWLHRLLDPLAWWWLRLDGAVAPADAVLYKLSDVARPKTAMELMIDAQYEPPVETCPRCHKRMDAWKTYADGRVVCLSCAHAPHKRHR